jgi:hypothetical protein
MREESTDVPGCLRPEFLGHIHHLKKGSVFQLIHWQAMEREGSVAAGTADGKYLVLGPVTILSWMLEQLKSFSTEGVVFRRLPHLVG